jgi:hypothetical protein
MKKLLLTLSQVYHRVEVLTDLPNETTSTAAAAAGSSNVFEAGMVLNDTLLCKPVLSGNEPTWHCSITHHRNLVSRACHRCLLSRKKLHRTRNTLFL